MRTFALILALWCTQAFAYLGTFDPAQIRSVADVTFYDEQFAGPRCASLASSPLEVLLSPLTVQAVACAHPEKGIVIAPISPGPGWLYGLATFATPNQVLCHEVRHIFDGHFHPPFISFIDRVRQPDPATDRLVSGDQQRASVQRHEPQHRPAYPIRVPGKGDVVCTFWTKDKSVSYDDCGALVRACLQ